MPPKKYLQVLGKCDIINTAEGKMKIKYMEKIGGYTIIRFITDAAVDPEKTKQKIEPMIKPDMTEQDIQRLYMKNLVYAKTGPEAELIDDDAGKIIQKKLDEKGINRQLLDNGEYVADFRGAEYWGNKKGKWEKGEIESIGVPLPSNAVLSENLTQEQQAEIAAQQRAEQIAAMSPQDRAKAEQAELDALADEAARLEKRAEIQGKKFDPNAWYGKQAAAVQAKYA
jgi:hypothetical protein